MRYFMVMNMQTPRVQVARVLQKKGKKTPGSVMLEQILDEADAILPPGIAGYLPVYFNEEDARKDFPGSTILAVTKPDEDEANAKSEA